MHVQGVMLFLVRVRLEIIIAGPLQINHVILNATRRAQTLICFAGAI